MGRSIRWRLQLGTGLLLTAVVGGFAGLLYVEARAARDRQAEADLSAAANYIDSALRSWPPHELDLSFPPPKGPKEGKKGPKDRQPKEGWSPPWERPQPSLDRLQATLVPPGWADAPAGERYFGVWRDDGSFVYGLGVQADRPPARPPSRESVVGTVPGGWEVTLLGPQRTTVLVGGTSARTDAVLSRFAARLALTGLAVLFVGFAGSWWLASRIVTPLAAITATASRISAANLTERIDAGRVDRELAELATVLNGTFARLDAAFAQLTRFTADASHELRTPLAVLRSNAELALSRPRTADEYREALTSCLSAATRMTAIVDGLLTLARADAGETAKSSLVDVAALATEAVAHLAPVAEKAGVSLKASTAPAVTVGDEVALGRVVANLVENAIRYNRTGGKVRVKVTAGEAAVELTVEDTGVGIGASHLPHIFDRFYRVDAARARSSGGTGLGLAICKSVVTAHGGEISVTSTEGVGTTFRVTLPFAPEDLERPKSPR